MASKYMERRIEKGSEYGIRSSLENFSFYEKIRVLPLYALGNAKNYKPNV
jgi:hypothetical protein